MIVKLKAKTKRHIDNLCSASGRSDWNSPTYFAYEKTPNSDIWFCGECDKQIKPRFFNTRWVNPQHSATIKMKR